MVGVNHRIATVAVREKLAFDSAMVMAFLKDDFGVLGIAEILLLSTCNRTEIYVETTDADRGDGLLEWLKADRSLSEDAEKALFALQGDAAVRHLFQVACGLDSMVLGEPQILGQLKDAFHQANNASTVGTSLGRLFRHAFSVAKKVRTDTSIGSSPVSVAYAAVTLANQFFAGFKQQTALLIGAGATIELVARHLHSRSIGRMFVANRDINRAQKLAAQFDAFALPLSELAGTLPDADILISSTASPDIIVSREQMEKVTHTRKRKPVFAVDIAVPRDLDPDIGALDDVYLYSIDDLDHVITEGLSNRESAVTDANRILDEEIARYIAIERAREVVPLITALRDQGNAVREEVMQQARRRLAKGADNDEVLEYVTASLLKKLLHRPTVRLREAGESADETLIEAASKLFGLKGGGE